MKIKDIERTANIAWSPKSISPIYVAAGTAAQQLDASFSTNAALEIYSLNLSEPGPDMLQKCSVPSDQRFHRVIWGSEPGTELGTIVGGCDAGLIQIYSASKLLNGENGLVSKQVKHSGPVHALDFNPFQQNLFATGSSESEIFIWDLNNTATPMTPGTKSQPLEDVLSISWNRQVQHILASTFATKCVIWDLRKNEPIIKLTDTVSRVRWKVVAWHPEVATQLCLASEEDHSPIIQLWDLRFATSPLKTMENHQRGILSIAWCRDDPDLLVSTGKDNRILAWNPNSTEAPAGEMLSEVAKTAQWNFDIQWCPKNPAIIACPSFDGHVSVYSLMGGKTQQVQTTNKIADSFPGMDGYVQAPLQQQSVQQVSADLSKAPKWLKRPIGATFGFGGKLISFDNEQQQQGRTVQISQVITEPDLVKKSTELEQALDSGHFTDYCRNKADETADQHKKYIWHFIRANFEENPRSELLNLLGYKIEDVNNKLNAVIGKQSAGDQLVDGIDGLGNGIDPFEAIGKGKPKVQPFKIKTGDDPDGLITQALLLGNVEAAVDLCLKSQRFADAIIIAMTGGADLLARTQHAYLDQCTGYVSSLISALISEDWAAIINSCDLSSWKEALAATLTHASDDTLPLLCQQLGNRLEMECGNDAKLKQDSQLCYICSGSFDSLVNSWSKKNLTSTNDLQELVELVVFLQKSVERQGRQVKISGALADLLTKYAGLLASQGHLSTALNYLGQNNGGGMVDEKVVSLRERLYVSLGHKMAQTNNYGRVPQQQQQQPRRQSRHSFSNNSYAATPNPAQPVPQFNTGLPAQPIIQAPWGMPAVPPQTRTFSPVASMANVGAPPTNQVLPPPRPTSVGSNQGASTGGLPSRKYVLDPSVASNPYGGAMPQYQQPAYNNNNNNSMAQFGQAAAPTTLIPQNNVNNNNFMGGGMAPPPPPPTVGEIAQERSYQQSAPGWNDPPAFSKPLRSQQKSEGALPAPQPITHPLYGSAPNNNGFEQQPPPPSGGFTPMGPMATVSEPQLFQPPPMGGTPLPNAPASFNPGGFKTNAIHYAPNQVQNQQPHQQQPQQIVQAAEKPQPIQKPPIPEEHIHMQTVFDELKYQCSCTANNPQTKRKLEDVGRKLEALYDLLRERKLTPSTLASLHQMVQLVQNGDYTGGLNLHTQLVSGQDFAQIASFMPGLKVLLQCALQLQVYLR